jgi:hypothetical protein
LETLAYYALRKIPEGISTLRVFDGALGMYLSIFDKYCFPTLQISSSGGTDLYSQNSQTLNVSDLWQIPVTGHRL